MHIFFLFLILFFGIQGIRCNSHGDISERVASIESIAARPDAAECIQRINRAWMDGALSHMLVELTHEEFLLLISRADETELAVFAEKTGYADFKIFIENYYSLFLACLETMSVAQLNAYLNALHIDFIKAVLFNSTNERVERLLEVLTPEKMSILVAIVAKKMPTYRIQQKKSGYNTFIRLEEFNRFFSSLSVKHLNALFASASAELLSEIMAIFAPYKI